MPPKSRSHHREPHRTGRSGWLRAAVLGANDGVVSTASLLAGVAAADAARGEVLLSGIAGLVAGAMSMAAGEYVSVSSQSDIERADIEQERGELDRNADAERGELATIYVGRGLDPDLAQEVARQLMSHDALGAHKRDEIGITDELSARPLQAALASALTFAVGASMPMTAAALAPAGAIAPTVIATSLVVLALLGGMAARAGGAPMMPGVLRVTFWGALAMGLTAAVGLLFGAVV